MKRRVIPIVAIIAITLVALLFVSVHISPTQKAKPLDTTLTTRPDPPGNQSPGTVAVSIPKAIVPEVTTDSVDRPISLASNPSYVPVEELPEAFIDATYSSVDLDLVDLKTLKSSDTIELYVPQISSVVKLQISDISENDYGVAIIAQSNSTGNMLALFRSDSLHAQGTLEIDHQRYFLTQHQDKLLIVNEEGFFREPQGHSDDAIFPPGN